MFKKLLPYFNICLTGILYNFKYVLLNIILPKNVNYSSYTYKCAFHFPTVNVFFSLLPLPLLLS